MVFFAVKQQNLKSEVKSNRAKRNKSVTLQLVWLTNSPRCPAGEATPSDDINKRDTRAECACGRTHVKQGLHQVRLLSLGVQRHSHRGERTAGHLLTLPHQLLQCEESQNSLDSVLQDVAGWRKLHREEETSKTTWRGKSKWWFIMAIINY